MTVLEQSRVDKRAEPGLTLADHQPRTLGFLDQTALWGNLGISLLVIVAGTYLVPVSATNASGTRAFAGEPWGECPISSLAPAF